MFPQMFPPPEHFSLVFVCVRRRSHPRKLKKNEHQRTATNNLHLTGGQGVVGTIDWSLNDTKITIEVKKLDVARVSDSWRLRFPDRMTKVEINSVG